MFSLFKRKKAPNECPFEEQELFRTLHEQVLSALESSPTRPKAEKVKKICEDVIAYEIDDAMDRWIEENIDELTDNGADNQQAINDGLRKVTVWIAKNRQEALLEKALNRIQKNKPRLFPDK